MTFSEQYQQFWITGDQSLGEKIFDKDITYTFNAIKVHGKKALMTHILERKKDFHIKYDISNICSKSGVEYHQWQSQAVLSNKFEGFPPTNAAFSYAGITLLKVNSDMITNIFMYSDIDEILKNMAKN